MTGSRVGSGETPSINDSFARLGAIDGKAVGNSVGRAVGKAVGSMVGVNVGDLEVVLVS